MLPIWSAMPWSNRKATQMNQVAFKQPACYLMLVHVPPLHPSKPDQSVVPDPLWRSTLRTSHSPIMLCPTCTELKLYIELDYIYIYILLYINQHIQSYTKSLAIVKFTATSAGQRPCLCKNLICPGISADGRFNSAPHVSTAMTMYMPLWNPPAWQEGTWT